MADPITWGLINGVKKGVKTVQSTLDGLLDDIKDEFDIFIGDAEEVIEKLGTGLPPRDLAAFSSQSTEDGIKLTFTPPAQTYIDDGGTNQFAVMPAGVLIRYSDTGYPRTPDEGKFGYDYKPTGDWVTTSQECTIVGLTKDTKYYFTAFPYSTEHVYNKNQVTANRTEMTWVGNKGTISVTVQTPEGYEGTLGEYTITLVDQASDSPQNVEKSATGAGLTQFGGLTAGKSYKVRLSNTDDLQAPPDSEAITIVGGVNYDVTMTYALMYGTITVNVSTQPAGMPIGAYTVTLTPNDSSGNLQQSGNNSQAVVFSNVKNGVVYTVGLSAINHYTANAGGTVTAVGGQNISHNAHYGYNATLSEASWSEISAVGNAKQGSSLWSVGDLKDIVVNGETLTIQIVGFNHDRLQSGGIANITFALRHLMSETRTMNSAVGAWLNSTVLSGMEEDLQNAIKIVQKKTNVRSGNYTPTVQTSSTRLFLFSEIELSGDTDNSYEGEGVQYEYFTSNSSRTKRMNNGSGSTNIWWERSPARESGHYCSINGAGVPGHNHANYSYGICFGFCV